VVKESVQGLSYSGRIRTMVGIEASASNERLDFALAEFDAEEPQARAAVRGAEAYGRQTTNEAALSWPEIALLSRDHDPSVHPLA
jgi:hypothetical protein